MTQSARALNWDFRSANTKEYTHCYHNYPAKMIPQIARRLIAEYGKGSKILFDPYCGTGTSLVEANLQNIDAIGTDLNPLARLITQTKTAKVNLKNLDNCLQKFNDFILQSNFSASKPCDVKYPDFENIDFWFQKQAKDKLATIHHYIRSIKSSVSRNFLYMAFSESIRKSSLTRNGEFKLYRMPEKQRANFYPDVYGMIISKLADNRKGLGDYIARYGNSTAKSEVFDFNTVETMGSVAADSIDLVVTSPPYGDSKTTVAYGQFSRLTNQWLGIKNAHKVDKYLMGGSINPIDKIGFPVVDNPIQKISNVHEKRGMEVYSFYKDYYQSIYHVAKVLKRGSYACYVVGNRRVKDIVLPTDKITRKFFEDNGFAHENTFVRNIPNKRMPSRNSPTNTAGKTAATMSKEYIVVMRKH